MKHFTQSEELVSLNIDFCKNITEESLKVIIEAAPPLKELYISGKIGLLKWCFLTFLKGCTKIHGKTIAELLEKTKYQLEIADLSNLTQVNYLIKTNINSVFRLSLTMKP